MHISILNQAEIKTMTSREIADLTGKDHRHVLADARIMLEYLGIDCAGFSAQYKDASGKLNPMFVFPKRETLILVSGYSTVVRAKIIDRWQELEAQALPTVPHTLSAALRLAADQADQIELQQSQLAITTPKAEALDRLTLADGSMCITNAAKNLGMQPKALFAWLQTNNWIYRRPGSGSWTAYQTRLKSMFLDHKVTTIERGDGSEKITEQVLVTAKGLAKLAEVTV
jgi:phage antirepressor YoqD-like protein